MKRETDKEKEAEMTSDCLRQAAAHLATQHGTEVSLFQDLMAAANALDENDLEKARRILSSRTQL